MRILVSAYACEPGHGSEPGVGWNVVLHLAKRHRVWAVTRANNRECIEAELARRPIRNLELAYYDLPGWLRFWKRGQRGVRLYYYLWQLGAYRLSKELHQEVQFELTHHVTFVKYSTPSLLSLLPVPFVWGPVGGAEVAPQAFWAEFGLRARVYEWMRELARWFGERDPLVRLTARRSAVAIATTEATARRLRCLGARRVHEFSEAGISEKDLAELAEGHRTEHGFALPKANTCFISMGRLLHWKGVHLGLRAFAAAGLPSAEYWVLGSGPERRRLEQLAVSLGIGEQVRFLGSMPRERALGFLKRSQVLVHPSLHDSGGWVCIEAMAAGKPVLCLDLGGPGTQVVEGTGIKVAAESPEQCVRELADAMKLMASDRRLRGTLGLAGRARAVTTFRWESKMEQLDRLYSDALRRFDMGKAS
jgi:glycosyltransferase involved in cell wall biosynthesis